MTSLTHEHVAHVHRRNESLEQRIKRLKERAAAGTEHVISTAEVFAGGLLGGVLQGMAKDQTVGPRLFHLPADLTIGLGLNLAGLVDLAGDYSDHLANVGTGFLTAFGADLGFKFGSRRRETGSFFHGSLPAPLAPAPLPPPPPVSASGDPQAMAAQLLAEMQAQQ